LLKRSGYGPFIHLQNVCDLPVAQAFRSEFPCPLPVKYAARPTVRLSFLSSAVQAQRDALLDQRPLQLGNSAQNGEDHLSDGRARIDALAEADEVHTESLKLFQGCHQVPRAPSKAIKSSYQDGINFSATGVF